MKRIFIALAAMVAATVSISSCRSDNFNTDGLLVNAIVTVKSEGGRCALQVEDDIKVYPTNVKDGIFGGREVRALTQFTSKGTSPLTDGQEVSLLWIDSVLTKKALVAEEGVEYGNDPVDIYNDWLTVAEDGYVNLHIRTYFGYSDTPHLVNLVGGTNPDNPYEFVFHHDAQGDIDGRANETELAFNIKDFLPKTAGEVELTVKFESFEGLKSFTLKTNVK